MEQKMIFLDRNEFNFEPSKKVVEAIRNFDPKTLCFYTRIYDQGKKSVISVKLSEIYNVPEEQVLLAYGGEDILKNAIHYYLMKGDNKKILIPEYSWWYYNKVASECYGTFEMYPLHEQEDTFAYDVDEVIEYTNRIHPRMLLLASPNNPTGNSLTSEEIGRIMEHIPDDTMVLIDEAYASFITSDTDYIDHQRHRLYRSAGEQIPQPHHLAHAVEVLRSAGSALRLRIHRCRTRPLRELYQQVLGLQPLFGGGGAGSSRQRRPLQEGGRRYGVGTAVV